MTIRLPPPSPSPLALPTPLPLDLAPPPSPSPPLDLPPAPDSPAVTAIASVPPAAVMPAPPVLAPASCGRSVVFLLDQSGSMWETAGDTSRLCTAKAELQRLVNHLEDGVRFTIILYSKQQRLFRRMLVPMTPENRHLARLFIGGEISTGGATDFLAAFATALRLKPETVVLLSDGEFNLAEAHLLRESARLRRTLSPQTRLHALAFWPRPQSAADRLLAKVCALHEGEVVLAPEPF